MKFYFYMIEGFYIIASV